MDDNRIKAVTPSLTKLKYDPNRKQHNEKKKKSPKNSHESTADNEHVFDDFA